MNRYAFYYKYMNRVCKTPKLASLGDIRSTNSTKKQTKKLGLKQKAKVGF